MAEKFLELLVTPAVAQAQARYYGRGPARAGHPAGADAFTADETQFIESRDSFYLSTVSESGWPYVQHRGGPPGFLHVVSPASLAFADFTGNRQLLTTGNLAANDRVCLFLMDYPQRTRLKILGHAHTVDARTHPDLVARFAAPDTQRRVERVVLIEVVSFDWNCPKYISPRYTVAEVQALVKPLQDRIAELENQLVPKSS
jgi:predicted pyridoxine 5'-phosphate oxidase superfamily flavin-nucleotide-binding protein